MLPLVIVLEVRPSALILGFGHMKKEVIYHNLLTPDALLLHSNIIYGLTVAKGMYTNELNDVAVGCRVKSTCNGL